MTRLALECHGVNPQWAKALASSLPSSFRLTEQCGEVVLLGGGGDWMGRLSAGMHAGQKRFVLCDPQVCPAGRLDDVVAEAQSRGVYITLCETHADNPAVAQFRAGLEGPCSAVTITGQGEANIADMLLQQLRLARAGFTPHEVAHSAAGVDQAIATLYASYGEEPVLLRLSVVASRSGGAFHRLMTHGRTSSASLQVWSGMTARPATAFHIVGERTTEQATIYEGAHRAVLRSLIGTPLKLAGGETLRQWNQDAMMARTMSQAS